VPHTELIKKNCPSVYISENDQAMDFIQGMANIRYDSFKTIMMNGSASKAIRIPENVKIIY
jgi:hypothetical protein